MKKRRLGRSNLVVSEICLGTMTFGSTCEENEAHRILDQAWDAGVDFLDTAEIYPVPPDAKYVHRTEEIVGRWLKNRPRDSVIVATKVCGPGHGWFVPPVRSGKTALDGKQIRIAIEGSLRRLQTDYVDLYQTHWPDQDANYEEILLALERLKEEGKIRVAGCSNENSWGLMNSLRSSERQGSIRYETIQNNYSLLNRRFEDELALVCRKEGVSLLPYSPLAGGVLSGKYNGGRVPDNARFSRYAKLGDRQKRMTHRFLNDKTLAATEKILVVARDHDLSSVALALAWSKEQDFVASTIVGANTTGQLEESLKAAQVELKPEALKRIDEISKEILYPMG